MDIVRFAVAALAVYRVARMIALERGPFEVFEHIRGHVLRRFGKDSWVFDGVTCPLCLSVWLALAAVWLLPAAAWTDLVLQWLGLSGAATLLYKLERL